MNTPESPLVSIIISTYNREKIITQTIMSAKDQTYSNKEIIVVDDGSTDNTKDVISKIPKINYIYQENAERGAARNRGIQNSKGDFIVILDSDDLLEPTMIENCIRPFLDLPSHSCNKKKLGVVFGQVRFVDQNEQFLGVRYKKPPPQGDVLIDILNSPLLQVTALVKKECFNTTGYFEEDRALSGSEDYELWFRIAQKYSFIYLDTPMLAYRVHEEQTASFPEKNHQNLMVLHKYIYSDGPILKDIIHHKEKSLALFHLYSSANAYAVNMRKLSITYYFKAITIYPKLIFRIKTVLMLPKLIIGRQVIKTIFRKH